ncbi:hypothetical protein V2S66_03065 [Streptomyces sp. V4-01]|uniref:Uncharacterized protein n=1 Tax=Actinacidiphila polyblastidii TaxID=3110430 RepID=A0ABU7P556_9ACTN|nr:hypothetical protein [Streptomyces sp. V4-01]
MSEPFERLTVLLTPASSTALREAADIIGDSETDTVNRSLQVYAMQAHVVAEGGAVLLRHGKDTDDATQAPVGESTQAAEPFVPRTEREHWVAIADALNACNAAGMPVGIDMEGILTDHTAWAVVWNRDQERWEVGGYEDGSPAETPADAEDWVICCSPKPRCPNGERRARALERGWTQNGRAGNWLCAEHSPDFFQPARTYTDAKSAWRFRCDTVTTHPGTGERTALGWRLHQGEWESYSYGEDDWDVQTFVGMADGGEAR